MEAVDSMLTHVREMEVTLQAQMSMLSAFKNTLNHLAIEDATLRGTIAVSGNLMTVDEVAKRLQMDRNYIYTLAKRGRIPSMKIGKYRRFVPAQIDTWMNSGGPGIPA